jgi:hypothetical protein
LKRFCRLLLFGIFCCLSIAAADKKDTLVRFGDSDLPVIRTKLRFTTLIVLPEGEEISEVTCGDKEYWVIEGKDGIVYVKPAKEGALTNVNVISKSKAVYSFLVQEISRSGNTKDKPDLKVLLGSDDLPKLKKDKENLEAVLAKTEKALNDLKEKAEAEKAKKKDELIPPATVLPKTEVVPPKADPIVPEKPKGDAVPAPTNTVVPEPKTSQSPPASGGEVMDETPLVKAYVIERRAGLVEKSGRLIGHFFLKVGQVLHLY